jgi:ABC-type nickel/cobalt efflux system permease component RcnA
MLAVGGWILGTRFAAMEAWLGIASTLLLVVLAAFYLWRVLTWKPSR